MKKLFLYISLLIFVFIGAFFIASFMYSHSKHKKNQEIILTESITEDDGNENGFLSQYNKGEFAESVNSYIDSGNNDRLDSDDKYIVGIENGYVIVYFNDMDTIYEFTDIDAGVLKVLDNEQYEKIVNHISFNSLEELFDFLESLAS